MSIASQDFVKNARKAKVVMRDRLDKITVDGQLALLRDCSTCGTTTPHGLTPEGKRYCGICGTENK